MALSADLTHFLASVHPYNALPDAALTELSDVCEAQMFAPGTPVFSVGENVKGLYVIADGEVEVTDETDVQLSVLGPRNSFGERALLRGDAASRTATASAPLRTIFIPAPVFGALLKSHEPVARFFDRRRPARITANPVATLSVEKLMTRDPMTCKADAPIRMAASLMAEHRISSVCVLEDEAFTGILTLRDLNAKVIVGGVDPDAPVSTIMTAAPLTLTPDALVTDVLHAMVERQIGHLPIVDGDRLVGIVTQTDLTRTQAMSSAYLIRRVSRADSAGAMADVTGDIPTLLAQLVDSGNAHNIVTRLITDITDSVTRRLLSLAEAKLGPAPVPYLWLACGSQGRQEQTGVSDQDNCLMLADDVAEGDLAYFQDLAAFVSDGLNTCGYIYCPGDMMATNPRWCQPVSTWCDQFMQWIAKPNPEAQMLASVMFDLRPIGGDASLFDGLQEDVLAAASRNSIFIAHMASNALKHQPPLGLLRGLATIRSGEHRDTLDLKHAGVVPVVDLGRVYALQGQITAPNTRARIAAALHKGVISSAGAADLLNAYDLIADVRLAHQAAQVHDGQTPSNFLNPQSLSDFERSHLRDAFVVVKTMQSALGSGKAALG